MTTYGSRIDELRDLLSQLPAAADERVNKAFVDLIGRYAAMRQSALDDLVDYMAKAAATNLGTQAKWQTRISRLASDRDRLFADAARDLVLPAAHQLYWNTAQRSEKEFADTLLAVTTPQLMDELLQQQDGLNKLIGVLQDLWTFLLSENQGIQNDEMRALQEVDEMIQSIVADMDTAARAAQDLCGRAVEAIKQEADYFKQGVQTILGGASDLAIAALKKYLVDKTGLGDAQGPMEEVLGDVARKAEASGEYARRFRTLADSYKTLMDKQKGYVLSKFNDTRRQVDGYLRENNVNRAEERLKQAKDQLSAWVSRLPGRQAGDGANFFNDVNRYLENAWTITKSLDEQFRYKFQGAFLATVDDRTIETLAQAEFYRDEVAKIKDRNALEKLDNYRRTLPEQLSRVEESLHATDDTVDSLPDEVKDIAKSMRQEFRDYVHDQIKSSLEALAPNIEALAKVVAPANLDEEFNRNELTSMLR
jgi:hypothetical protein